MTLACTTCSSLAVLAVRPGCDDVIGAGIVLQRGEPARAWCWLHWPVRGHAPAPPRRDHDREAEAS